MNPQPNKKINLMPININDYIFFPKSDIYPMGWDVRLGYNQHDAIQAGALRAIEVGDNFVNFGMKFLVVICDDPSAMAGILQNVEKPKMHHALASDIEDAKAKVISHYTDVLSVQLQAYEPAFAQEVPAKSYISPFLIDMMRTISEEVVLNLFLNYGVFKPPTDEVIGLDVQGLRIIPDDIPSDMEKVAPHLNAISQNLASAETQLCWLLGHKSDCHIRIGKHLSLFTDAVSNIAATSPAQMRLLGLAKSNIFGRANILKHGVLLADVYAWFELHEEGKISLRGSYLNPRRDLRGEIVRLTEDELSSLSLDMQEFAQLLQSFKKPII